MKSTLLNKPNISLTRMRKPTKHIFNVILTFESTDCMVFDLAIRSEADELEFVITIIRCAAWPKSLIRMSACLVAMCDFDGGYLRSITKDDVPEFLHKSRGKYCFNDEDEWSRGWKGIRDQVVADMNNQQSATSD